MPSRELVLAFATVLAVTAGYWLYVSASGVPPAGGLVGHLIGVIGLTLMLLTETLYSFRKRAMRRPIGSMRAWLRAHIYMGIVGPYLVLLHSAWTFNGLAGALTVMVGVVVASGFVGRYIYTAVPRTADGVVVEAGVLEAQLAAASASGAALGHADRSAGRRLRRLERQIAALRWQRRVLATWHAIHVPLGMTMFVVAFTHVVAALYYSTLLR